MLESVTKNMYDHPISQAGLLSLHFFSPKPQSWRQILSIYLYTRFSVYGEKKNEPMRKPAVLPGERFLVLNKAGIPHTSWLLERKKKG